MFQHPVCPFGSDCVDPTTFQQALGFVADGHLRASGPLQRPWEKGAHVNAEPVPLPKRRHWRSNEQIGDRIIQGLFIRGFSVFVDLKGITMTAESREPLDS